MAKSAELEKPTETGHQHDRIEVKSVFAPTTARSWTRRPSTGVSFRTRTSTRSRRPRSPSVMLCRSVSANVAAPINAALALNVLSDGSLAYASATRARQSDQSM